MTERRPAAIRKSDLTPAFEAAKTAGFAKGGPTFSAGGDE